MTGAVQQNRQTAFTEVDGEVVLVDPSDSRMYWLNPVASRVWTLADEPALVEAVAATLCDEFDVDYERALGDVQRMVDAFLDKGLFCQADGARG